MTTPKGSIFLLFVVAAGLAASTPVAFSDHSTVTIEPVAGSGVPGCDETGMYGCYNPGEAVIDIGGTIIFSNTDTVAHTFTSGTPSGGPDGTFDSSLVIAGASFEYKPEVTGEIPHFCIVHPWMTGMIIVSEDDDHDDAVMTDDDAVMTDDDAVIMLGDDPVAEGMMSDGTIVAVWSSIPMADQPLKVKIAFVDAEHVNYDVMITQNGESVTHDKDMIHVHDAPSESDALMTDPLPTGDPVDISIIFYGYGVSEDEMTGPIGEEIVFTNIVPEFGTIAMLVLAVAIVSIIAVTAKSRVIPRL